MPLSALPMRHAIDDCRDIPSDEMFVGRRLDRSLPSIAFARITKPSINQATEGRLVIFYFPYMGT